MPLLLRWLLAALIVDLALSAILTLVCLIFGWSPFAPIMALVQLTR